MNFTIRSAISADADTMLSLMPRLADFSVPEYRNPDHLWQGDRDTLTQWLAGDLPQVSILVADEQGAILGLSMIRLGVELLSHEPSAHLEVLVLAKSAEGRGVGQALIIASEQEARQHGAESMSLHVFANNTRARGLYEKMGFSGELLRYYKPL